MIPESIDDLSVIATNNVPQGGDNVGGTLDDILRAIQAIMKRDLALKKAETAEGTGFTPGDGLNSTTVQGAIAEVVDFVKSLDDLVKNIDIGGYMTGMVVMWSGAADNIPPGWALCNGSNGTPDLRGRFVIGAGGAYNPWSTGGGSIPSHDHGAGTLEATSAGSHSHSASTNSTGAHTHSVSGAAEYAGGHTHNWLSGTIGNSPLSLASDHRRYGNEESWHETTWSGEHTHSVSGTAESAGRHSHTVTVNSGGAHTHTISGSTAAAGSGSEVIAKYYALCFIMKL
jgi:hypothetical protein